MLATLSCSPQNWSLCAGARAHVWPYIEVTYLRFTSCPYAFTKHRLPLNPHTEADEKAMRLHRSKQRPRENATLLAVGVSKGAMSQGRRKAALDAGTGNTCSPLEPPGGCSSANTDFSPFRLVFQTSGLHLFYKSIHYCCFKPQVCGNLLQQQ